MKADIELHSHIYFERYGMDKVIDVMMRNGLDIIAPIYLNKKSFDDVRRNAEKLSGYCVTSDSLAVKVEKDSHSFYFLRGAELDTAQECNSNFHMITLGCDEIQPFSYMESMIEKALENKALVIWDHPYVCNDNAAREISRGMEDILVKRCRAYSGNIALEWNGYCIPWVRRCLGGKDVNRLVKELSKNLAEEGVQCPVVTDTDLHARTAFALKALGNSRISAEVNTSSGRDIIDSLKNSIFSGAYKNTFRTVPLLHFVPCWGFPYALRKFTGIDVFRPRG